MKITIESITEWEQANATIAGDNNHGATTSEILAQLAEETRLKKENEWTKGLPFVREVKDNVEEEQARQDVLEEYAYQYCLWDYLQPVAFDGRVES